MDSKKSLILVITILVGFNIFLLSKNSNLKSEINSNNLQILPQKDHTHEINVTFNNERVSNSDFDLSASKFHLFVFFPTDSCASCLVYEISNLNKFYDDHKVHTKVYLVGENKSVLEKYGAKFPFKPINPKNVLLDREFNFATPVALLIDSNGMVQQTYIAEVGNEYKSEQFYRRITSLFNSLQ